MKMTEAKPERLALVAVMYAVPACVDVIVEAAMPLLVELGDATAPMLEVKVTSVPSTTGLLYWSTTVAVRAPVSPTVRMVGYADSVTV